ncbi:MAG: MBL fold metallo-hydrolase [Hyphomicrobiales bacterium]|nr:MAG: MBL fold metallo-hydrolase [Hyphomicrobiales bacterium]
MKTTLALVAALAFVPAEALALETVKVADNVYAFVGELGQRSPTNFGNNATFGLIVTADGAVLVDPGGSWKGAEELDKAVGAVTDQPVKIVIDTGGQDHRWLGNGYWRAKGATIIASDAAIADQHDRVSMQFTMLTQLLGGELAGTEAAYADTTFAENHTLTLGGTTIEIHHPAPAHTPGDSFVWLPAENIVFTGDIVYVDRLLGVMDHSSSKGWIEAFDAFAALDPAHVVPGHGHPTTLEKARAETYDYLKNLRARIGEHLESGGDMIGAPKVDQSAFSGLAQFDALAGRNAQAVFAEMEFE